MAYVKVERPDSLEKYEVKDSKLYKAFINYLRYRGAIVNECASIPLSEPVTVEHGAAKHVFFDLDCLEGLFEYDWSKFDQECEQFRAFLSTVKNGLHKIGCKTLAAKFNLDSNKLKLGYKRLKLTTRGS